MNFYIKIRKVFSSPIFTLQFISILSYMFLILGIFNFQLLITALSLICGNELYKLYLNKYHSYDAKITSDYFNFSNDYTGIEVFSIISIICFALVYMKIESIYVIPVICSFILNTYIIYKQKFIIDIVDFLKGYKVYRADYISNEINKDSKTYYKVISKDGLGKTNEIVSLCQSAGFDGIKSNHKLSIKK